MAERFLLMLIPGNASREKEPQLKIDAGRLDWATYRFMAMPDQLKMSSSVLNVPSISKVRP